MAVGAAAPSVIATENGTMGGWSSNCDDDLRLQAVQVAPAFLLAPETPTQASKSEIPSLFAFQSTGLTLVGLLSVVFTALRRGKLPKELIL
jgi:hypothetical protein